MSEKYRPEALARPKTRAGRFNVRINRLEPERQDGIVKVTGTILGPWETAVWVDIIYDPDPLNKDGVRGIMGTIDYIASDEDIDGISQEPWQTNLVSSTDPDLRVATRIFEFSAGSLYGLS